MFREMRRKRQQLSQEESEAILRRNSSGVLSLLGDGDYPYGVPLSYCWEEGKLYFHCAKTGHKVDGARRHPKASFCVIDQDEVVPEKFTTVYRSVIAFGRIGLVSDPAEMRRACLLLAEKYSPSESQEAREEEIDRHWANLAVLRLEVEHLTGKEGLELLRRRG